MTRLRGFKVTLVMAVALMIIGLIVVHRHCPATGVAFSKDRRDIHRLKNRTSLPQPSDFDVSITLSSVLQPGEDSNRWSTSRAAKLDGYVTAVAKAGVELANCYSPCRRDTHIDVALRADAPAREHIVLEITPRMEEWARVQGLDWSASTLKQKLTGHWCSFEGWLFFDLNHAAESENTAPQRQGNWRASAWEIHPITKIEVLR
ncbi:MAG TPA: hypothetical protein VF899_03680 [Pyrinomonadaceae bacterium]